jgi:hypothetical protein
VRQFRSDDTSIWRERYGDGSDGVKTVSSNVDYDGANAGCSGTAAATALTLDAASTFVNGDLVLIHQSRGTGVGSWELNKIASGGGTTSLTLAYPLENTYTDSGASQAQILELKQYSEVNIQSGFTLSAPEWDGNKGGIVAFLCKGTVTVTGNIVASGKGYIGGDAVNSGQIGFQGEGTVGAATQSTAANGNGAGAGGDFQNQGGAGGGHAAAGSTNGTAVAGAAVGLAALTTMMFGGAGGGFGSFGGHATQKVGGDGGGIALIIGKTITVTGSIVTNGVNGTNIVVGADNVGGGGGAGGSVLLKGQIITLGSSLVTASAGSGAAAGGGAKNGGNAAVGRIHADYSQTLTGTTAPTIDSRQDSALAELGGIWFGVL